MLPFINVKAHLTCVCVSSSISSCKLARLVEESKPSEIRYTIQELLYPSKSTYGF